MVILAVRFYSVNIIIVILICGVIGAVDLWYQSRKEKGQDAV